MAHTSGSDVSFTRARFSWRWQDYMLQVLMVEASVWGEIQSPTLVQAVRLCHLQQLFIFLEERMTGSPLDAVGLNYRDPLPQELQARLRWARLRALFVPREISKRSSIERRGLSRAPGQGCHGDE
jgi:hypothetical protein